MNFILMEMTFLRYFIPLISEGNKCNKKCNVFITNVRKYTNCKNNMGLLEKFSKEYDFNLFDIEEIENYKGLTFIIEGAGINYLNENHKIVALTYMSDFSVSYGRYIDKVDNVILPSKKCAEHYKCISPKNLYLGSPKYDVTFDKKEIYKKYDLPKDKKILLSIAPKNRYKGGVKVEELYSKFRELGYFVVTKTRGKDPIHGGERGNKHLVDGSWYPHSTLEILSVADLVLNFGSSGIKECVMYRVPIINFRIKPHILFPFLYDYDYVKQMGVNDSVEDFKEAIEDFESKDLEKEFDKSIKENLFNNKYVCKNILKEVLK